MKFVPSPLTALPYLFENPDLVPAGARMDQVAYTKVHATVKLRNLR